MCDAVTIPVRSAPVPAILYAAFDLVGGAMVPLKTLVVARFIDAAIGVVQGSTPLATAIGNLMLVVAFTSYEWLKRALHNFVDLKLVLSLRERYRSAVVEKQMRLAYRYLEDGQSCDLMQRIATNAESGSVKTAYFHLIDLVAFSLKVAGLLLILTSAVWWGGLALLAVSALTLVMGIKGGKLQYQAERATSRYERRTGYLAAVLVGREAACERTLFGYTPWMNGLWRKAFQTAFSVMLKVRSRWYVRSYVGNAVATLSWVSMMVILLGPVLSGKVSVGLFIALTQSLMDLDIVWGFMQTVNGIARDSEFFRDLTTFISMDEVTEVRCARHPKSSPVLESLELRNVRFRYPGAGHDILNGLSCTFQPGRHYAIVGANGAGKTTVTRLVTGLYPIQAGDILLNGIAIRDYPPEELRSHFAIVYQDFARYGLTLRENIAFGRLPEGEPEDRFWTRLLQQVGLEETVKRLPQGLDTPLGKLKEEGMDLSGGEWQRVAMARALAQPGSILILDEPTASLDPLAESRLYELFARITKRKTTLFISHRLGATKLADEILVLSDGTICESGSHAALMEYEGLYHRMYESQRSWYEH